MDEGIKSLKVALNAGFDDYPKVRSDKNLATIQKSPKFTELIDQYDEPVIDWAAIKGTFGAFGKMFKKD